MVMYKILKGSWRASFVLRLQPYRNVYQNVQRALKFPASNLGKAISENHHEQADMHLLLDSPR